MEIFGLKILTLITVLGIAGCDSVFDRSKTRSLDNLEDGQSLKFHQCRAGVLSPSTIPADVTAIPNKNVKDALEAVPKRLLDMFFDKQQFAGVIKLESDIKKACWPSEQPPTRVDDGLGCRELTRSPEQSIILHLASGGSVTDAQQAYALVLRFGLIYSELVLSRYVPPAGAIYWSSPVSGSRGGQVQAMALQFITDVKTKIKSKPDRDKKLNSFAESLKVFGIQEDLVKTDEPGKLQKLWNALDDSKKEDFSMRVLAEAFHSYYCNVETHTQFATDYSETFRIFNDNFATDFNGDQKVQVTVPKSQIKASSIVIGWYAQNGANLNARLSRREGVGHEELQKLAGKIKDEQSSGTPKFGLGVLQNLMGFLFGGFGGLGNMFGGMGMGGMGMGGMGMGGMGTGGMGYGGGFNGGLNNNRFNNGMSGGGVNNGFGGGPYGNLNSLGGGGVPPSQNNFGGGTGNWGGSNDQEVNIAFDAGNKYRVDSGVPALTWNENLARDCQVQAQAQDQVKAGTSGALQHCMPTNGVCPNPENIAMNPGGGQAVATAWYNSAGHRANLLNTSHTSTGIGRVGDQWCQRFQ